MFLFFALEIYYPYSPHNRQLHIVHPSKKLNYLTFWLVWIAQTWKLPRNLQYTKHNKKSSPSGVSWIFPWDLAGSSVYERLMRTDTTERGHLLERWSPERAAEPGISLSPVPGETWCKYALEERTDSLRGEWKKDFKDTHACIFDIAYPSSMCTNYNLKYLQV